MHKVKRCWLLAALVLVAVLATACGGASGAERVWSYVDEEEPSNLTLRLRLAVNADDTIYVFTTGQAIQTFSPDGELQDTITIEGNGYYTDFVLADDGTFWMVQNEFRAPYQLQRVAADGAILDIFDSPDDPVDETSVRSGAHLVAGPDDNLYVAVQVVSNTEGAVFCQIEVWTPEGEHLRAFRVDPDEDGSFADADMAFTPDGSLYLVSDNRQTQGTLRVFDADGNFVEDRDLPGDLSDIRLSAITITPDGDIYLGGYRHPVYRLDADFNVQQTISAGATDDEGNRLAAIPAPIEGSINSLRDMAVLSSGDLITTDRAENVGWQMMRYGTGE